MDRVSMVGTVLMALLVMTTPVAATAPVASQSNGPGQSGMQIANAETDPSAPSTTVSLNDTDGNDTTSGDTTTDSTTPCCGGGGGPVDRSVWRYDANYDLEINYSEADASYQDYLDDIVTWETYLNVSDAYFDNETVLYPDPDGDGMTIREEEVWSDHGGGDFARYVTNTDDDGFSDFQDKRPQKEDEPPEVNLSFDSKDEVTVSANDNEGLSRVSLHEAGTYSYTDRPLSGTSAEETFTLNSNTEYWVNVTDVNNNEYGILFETGSDGSVEVKKAGFAVMAFGFASPVPGDEIVTTPAAVTMVLFAAAIATVLTLGTSGETENIPHTGSENEYENVDASVTQYFTDEKLPVRLPSGFGEEISDPAGGSLYRGHGWEYIQLTLPGITQNEIGDILRYPNKVEELDDGALVIGDNPNGPGEITLHISDGLVVSAAVVIDRYPGESETPFEPVLTDEGWEHILDSHPEMTRQLLHQIVENGDQVTEHRVYRKGTLGDDNRVTWTWVAVINGNVYMVRGTISETTGQIRIGTARDTGKTLSEYDKTLRDKGYTRTDS